MISLESLLVFCATSGVLILTPGPNQIYVIARSTSQGARAGGLSALGVGAGTFVHVLAAALGLAALLASSAVAFQLIKYAGAAYLIYLGIRTWTRKDPLSSEAPAPQRASGGRIVFQGLLTNVLNPKVALFFLAFLPQFVDTSRGHVIAQTVLLGSLFALMGLVADLAVVSVASSLGAWLRRATRVRRMQRRFTAGVYIVLGLSTAFAQGPRR